MNWSNLLQHAAKLSIVLWVGSIWAIGYIAVPVLFQTLPDRQLAGLLAGKMFTCIAYVGIGCAIFLLVHLAREYGRAVWKQKIFMTVLTMLILIAVGQLGIQPVMEELKAQALPQEVMQSPLAAQFKWLHGVSRILFLLQSILGFILVTMELQKKKFKQE